MKAMPASTKWFSKIRTAATMLPIRPVIEMAFGVSRDSIRRSRASSRISVAVSGPPAPSVGEPPVGRGEPFPSPARGGAVPNRAAHAGARAPVRQAQASGRSRAKPKLAA